MFREIALWWNSWTGQRHPRLLLLATASLAIVALLLMFRVGDAAVVLYKEF